MEGYRTSVFQRIANLASIPHPGCFAAKSPEETENKRVDFFWGVQKSAEECEKKEDKSKSAAV